MSVPHYKLKSQRSTPEYGSPLSSHVYASAGLTKADWEHDWKIYVEYKRGFGSSHYYKAKQQRDDAVWRTEPAGGRGKGAKGLGRGIREEQKSAPAPKPAAKPPKREESPETKRIRQDKARSRYYAKRGRDEPVRGGKSAAAWQGLENNGRGDATYAYKSIMKDAKQHGYNVSKQEAAMTAKKHPDTAVAVQRARAHHNVVVGRKKKQKTE